MKRILPILISIIALCISCYAAFVCDKRIEADWMGVLVGVLSLLVTVLIGWNIYTFIDIKGTSQKIDKFRSEFEGKIKESSSEAKLDMKLEMMRAVPVLIARQQGDLISSLQFMFKAFHDNKDNGNLAKIMAREYILNTIMDLINNENKNLIEHLVNDMKGTLRIEEIEDFLHEFMSYSDEDKNQRYAGMQNVLLELLKAQI